MSTSLRSDATGSFSIGVDVGATKILAGLVDENGQISLTARRESPPNDPVGVLALVSDVVEELSAAATKEVVGVGLGVAGPVDAERSTVFFAPNLGWSKVPVRELLEASVRLPVVVENDSNAAAWGEFRHGAGVEVEDLIVVTIGTGIGGGIIVGGVLLRGAFGAAGEIGHVNAVPDGYPCGCGRSGCWEQYASGSALVRQARSMALDRMDEAQVLLSLGDGTAAGIQGIHLTEAAGMGDPVACAAFEWAGIWLGRGLADLAATLDPAAFVIGGGVCEAGDLLLAPARATLRQNMSGQNYRLVPEVRRATLGNNAGLIGAADLARIS